MPTPPPLPTEKQYRQLKKELCVFPIFLGVLLVAAGWYFYTSDSVHKGTMFGVAWNVAWGVPPMVIGILNVTAGLLFAVTSWRAWVFVVMGGGALFALNYFLIMTLSTGKLPINLMSIAFAAVPVVVIQHGIMFLKLSARR